MRIMPDSNTVFSAALRPESFLRNVIRNAVETHSLILSSYVKKELYRSFQKKFPTEMWKLDSFFEEIKCEQFLLPEDWRNLVDLPYIRDPKDEEILASAILSYSDILITGDKDFDNVHCPNVMIMTPRQFWDWNEEQKQ